MSTGQEETVHLDLPATYKNLHILSAVIAAFLERVEGIADPEQTIYAVQLASHETCANIIDHAYLGITGGRISVQLTLFAQPQRLLIDLFDNGQIFDETQVTEPNLDEPRESGYGLFLIRSLMDSVVYDRQQSQNHWRLIKYL